MTFSRRELPQSSKQSRLGQTLKAIAVQATTAIFLSLVCVSPALAESPLAVLRSEKNQAAYSEQHIGEFDEDWKSFKRTFETANVRYDQLSDNDLITEGVLAKYKLVVIPLLLDMPPQQVAAVKSYVAKGGKIVVTDGCGVASAAAAELIALAGAKVTGHHTMEDAKQFLWPRTPFPLTQDFSVGTLTADIVPAAPADAIAKWVGKSGEDAGTALASEAGNAYIGWAPGLQGNISANAQILSTVLEEASPGITQQAAVQISYADYQMYLQELDYLQKRTDEVIKTAKQADLAVPFTEIQKNYEAALTHVEKFNAAYKERRFYEASEQVASARHEFALSFAKAMPVRPVEARAVWLDRGTIIATKNEKGMIDLIQRLKAGGINIIYFETNNAGFAMFPSTLAVQNPQLNGWDALGTALEQAHKNGMEFHAWFWNFNVGNERHNPIIGKDSEYPGPVLSTRRFSWALAGKNGSLFGHNQHEYWVNPANPEARQYCGDLMREVVTKYPVDGVQYDYIRYPFNGKPNQMGWDWVGRLRFERETGLSLDNLDDEGAAVWQAWKIAQVNQFVEETSNSIRKIRPGIRISAAVYGTPRRLRCWNLQQEWETWINKGWIDTLNPMTYVGTAKELQIQANNCRESSEDKALVYPGLSIRQLDTAGFIEQLDTARDIGTLGTTLFAVAQLDDQKLELLSIGPYRRPAVMTPQSSPVKASTLLVDDFVSMVNRYLADPKKRVIADTASTNEVVKEMDAVQRSVHSLPSDATSSDIDRVKDNVLQLRKLMREWLRIDAFAQRGFRAQYMLSYLTQIESILTYASHRSGTQNSSEELAAEKKVTGSVAATEAQSP